MLRTHDVVVADGTFRVVLTPKRRIVAALHVHESMLGPLHLAFEVDRSAYLEPHLRQYQGPHSLETAGIFDDIGHGLSKAAEGTFNAASKVATTVARPAFNVAKGAIAEGTHLVAHATPFLPAHLRHQMDSAAHVVLKARLGDVNAKQFIKTIATAAKAGVHAAQHVGNALLDATKFVAKAIDVPVLLASQIPGAGGIIKGLSPLEHFQKMVTSLQKGDFKGLEKMVKDDISAAQGIVSLVPGIGTGVSSAIGAGLAALEGGKPLEIAIKAAYGAIPIPPGIRQITDVVLNSIIALLEHPHDLTDVALHVARDRVPSGLPREVFDTLAQVVLKHVPVQKAAGGLVDHFVHQYAPAFGGHTLDHALHGLHMDPGELLAHAAHGVGDHATHAAHGLFNHAAHATHAAHDVADHAAHAASQIAHTAHALPALANGGRMLQPLHLLHG